MIAHIKNKTEVQTVFEHLEATATLAKEKGKSLNLQQTMFLIGLLHDFGKETKAFDDYIRKAAIDPKSVRRGEINHSSAGGKFLFEKFGGDSSYRGLTAQLMATAIFSHHGLVDCLDAEGIEKFLQRVSPQQEIYYKEALLNNKNLLAQYKVDELFGQAEEEITEALQKLRRIAQQMDGKKSELQFLIGCLERLILSILIDADRTDTAMFMTDLNQRDDTDVNELWPRFQENLENGLAKLNNRSEIGKLRERMSQECFSFGEKETGIYCLPIPTGGGKTFCSLRFALRHAIEKKKKKIIYVAPFLSILEQNAKEIRDILQAEDYLLEHHSNVVYEKEESENSEELNQNQLLTETWQSPIIATTMVQFLNTLFAGKTQSIRRMHQLQDAIIIIDEIQSLPVVCVYLFNVMMNFLAGFCNTTVILCSATQPLLAEVKKKIVYSQPRNMVSGAEDLVHAFKRVTIDDKRITGGYGTEELTEFVLDNLTDNLLIILNTKGAVRKLYDALSKQISAGILLFQLSTYMCAQHRSDVIDEIKRMLPEKRVICISTQLIEAGVDISFRCVIRSLAGLDSIMQAAGRCNRNGNDEGVLGKVYIINYNEESLAPLEDIRIAKEATEGVLYEFNKMSAEFENDLSSVRVMDRYYQRYFGEREKLMGYSITQKEKSSLAETVSLYDLLSENQTGKMAYKSRINDKKMNALPMLQAFRQAGNLFKVIGNETIGLIVPYRKAKASIELLKEADSYKERKKVLRSLQRYTVNLYREDKVLKSLYQRGGIEGLFEDSVLILSEQFYQEMIGASDELQLLIN